MSGAHVVVDLAEMSGRWVMGATTLGYFDSRPRVEAASLVYRRDGERRMRFEVRFDVLGRIARVVGRQSRKRSPDGLFHFRGWGGWLSVARINWDLIIADDGTIAIAANTGSLVAPAGLIVFTRPGVVRGDVQQRIAAHHRDFGMTSSQMRQLDWRDERRSVPFG